jgi:protein-L-isoaspartate O-methyltransferase
MLYDMCKTAEGQLSPTTREILDEFGLLDGHPWADTARDPMTTYYACLHTIVRQERPRNVLEIGTAFGMGTATLLKSMTDRDLLVSLDLGVYGAKLGWPEDNIEFARSRLSKWCERRHLPSERIRLYRANTQPPGKGDNDGLGVDVSHWSRNPELVRLLQWHDFDVIFVDGKHTEDGLINDLETFWPFVAPGGLIICDDIHDPAEYTGLFSWIGDTWKSFHSFIDNHRAEIADQYIWEFPRTPPAGKAGVRPFGLIRKTASRYPTAVSPGFEMFDSEGAMRINRARQDHLASLGLELVKKSVLEVGAGVGWHTGFLERLGCRVVSTDGRPENVREHLIRFPYREGSVFVADLAVEGSHGRLGDFDIVYCYGTMYHLGDPGLCIRQLAKHCGELFLLETCVSPIDNGEINLVKEDPTNPNQSILGIGCRPGRDWVMTELRKHFPFVYVTVTQPNHPDFDLDWPASKPNRLSQLSRSVFVASRCELALPTLSTSLLSKQACLAQVLP